MDKSLATGYQTHFSSGLCEGPHAHRQAKAGLLQEVLNREQSTDDAYTALVAYKKNVQWVQAIETLLEKQSEEPNLNSENFINAGQELHLKSVVKKLVRRVRVLMED